MASAAAVLRAAAFAAHAHRAQRRKDAAGTPYIVHPLGVAASLANEGGVQDTDTLVAALLHDTVEDTDVTLEQIAAEFGPAVAAIVNEVTDDKALPKAERKRLQVANAPHKSVPAKLVKLADKLYNLRDLAREVPVGWTAQRVQEYFAWARDVVAGIRGTNAALEAAIDNLMDTATFTVDGVTYKAYIGKNSDG